MRPAAWLAGWLLLAAGLVAQAPPPLPSAAAGSSGAAQQDPDAGEECTVGVACGRATVDGRPLMWKNRDAKQLDNVVTAFDDGRFPYVGICNAGSSGSVWGGANAAGFCIMNSLSRDLQQTSKKGPSNGPFMKLALRTCATVEEFEQLLEKTNETGRRTRANFGVIDAHGGAAFFEASHGAFMRFDAAESPSGLLVRANFALTGGGNGGRARFDRATSLCSDRLGEGRLDPGWLLQDFLRDLAPPPSAVPGEPGRLDVRETIHRQTTVAGMVFHGCKPGEDPAATTMWAMLGPPLFAVAVPCWPAAGHVDPALAGDPRSALCDAALAAQRAFYVSPPSTGATDQGEDDVAGPNRWLLTGGLDDALAPLRRDERKLLDRVAAQWRSWRRKAEAPDRSQLRALHAELAGQAVTAVRAFAAAASRRAETPAATTPDAGRR